MNLCDAGEEITRRANIMTDAGLNLSQQEFRDELPCSYTPWAKTDET